MTERPFASNYSIQSTLCPEDDNRWCTMITNEISVSDEERDDFEEVIAKAAFCYVDVEGAAEAHLTAFELFDLNGWIHSFYELYDPSGSFFTEQVCIAAGLPLVSRNLFIVDKIEILPNYRGEKLAAPIIEEAARLFSGHAELLALRAHPLQHDAYEFRRRDPDWELALQLPAFDSVLGSARQTLVDYFECLGFIPIGNEGLMIRA